MAKTDLLNFLKDINYVYNDCGMYDCVSKMLEDFEAEIRAKAQREIAEWCFDNKVDFRILERYADKEEVVDCFLKHFTVDQLKEEK